MGGGRRKHDRAEIGVVARGSIHKKNTELGVEPRCRVVSCTVAIGMN